MQINTNTGKITLTKFEKRTLENAKKIIGGLTAALTITGNTDFVPNSVAQQIDEMVAATETAEDEPAE